MNSFIIAVQLLTIIPVRIRANYSNREYSGSLAYFPLAGFLIGLSCVGINMFAGKYFPDAVLSVIIVLFMAFITGGMHLDGLADTIDGLSGSRTPEKMLEIMRDSRIGTMGVIGLMGSLALKTSLLYSMPANFRNVSLILALVVSRWSMVLPLSFFHYARAEGKARIFFENPSMLNLIISTLITLAISFYYFKFNGLYTVCCAGLVSLLVASYVNSKIKGLTGDTLGAISETVEIVSFALVYLFVV